jgi:hypothetical protein
MKYGDRNWRSGLIPPACHLGYKCVNLATNIYVISIHWLVLVSIPKIQTDIYVISIHWLVLVSIPKIQTDIYVISIHWLVLSFLYPRYKLISMLSVSTG